METSEIKYSAERILSIRRWTDKLLTFRLTRPEAFRFTPGQFARLGLPQGEHGQIWRAYSMTSASWDEHLEFYSIIVPNGQFTSMLDRLQAGDELLLDRQANGFFTTDRFPDGRDLWMLATGTGLAPYLSMLHDPKTWERFARLILIHSVRHVEELSYQPEIDALRQHPLWTKHRDKLRYLPVVTRDAPPHMLHERLPALIADGTLEHAAGCAFDPQHSRIMICGNPQMVADTHRLLIKMGYQLSRLKAPAQLAVENGW